MVDDIRPKEPPVPEDQNKDDLFNSSNFSSPPANAGGSSAPSDFDKQPHFSNQQQGFVVLPNGKGFSSKPFDRLVDKVRSLSRTQKIIASAVTLIILGGAGGGVYALTHKPAPPPPAPAPVTKQEAAPQKPTNEASRLTGVQISPKLNKKHVTSIQIENSPDARPQSGLIDAGVVFEAIAEGGITRFNASFLEAQPSYIGPIRSVRPYYAELAAPFDPVFVHAGGSGAGLARLAQLGIKDLDHGANGEAFQRISERYAPHNLYSSMAALDKAAAKRGYKTSNVKSFERKAEEKGKKPKAATINMEISGYYYNTQYKYDAKNNVYKRFMAGAPHKDQRSGKQIAPKVVIAIITDYHQDGIYSVYRTTGIGTAFIFQDGQVQKVTWKKTGPKEQFKFIGADKKPVGLDPGQTWVTLLKNSAELTYSP